MRGCLFWEGPCATCPDRNTCLKVCPVCDGYMHLDVEQKVWFCNDPACSHTEENHEGSQNPGE